MDKFYLFGILCLSAWRIASLVANEKGPFHMFYHLRRFAVRIERKVWIVRQFHLWEGMTCEWCNSIWFGTLLWLGWHFIGDEFVKWMTPLAISTVVIIIKYIIQGLENLNKSVVESEEQSPAPSEA